jgi:starch phosphorylase
MKVLVNGGLNLSEPDGWWAEAYTPDVGWALGDGREHGDDPAWDAEEAEALYALLEREIAPAFYARDERGIPTAWIARMRASMATLTPRFSTNRTVREYTERYYLPAAAAYRARTADGGALAARLAERERHLAEHWGEARFGPVHAETRDARHEFAVEVHLGGLDPDAVRVELFAEPADGSEPPRYAMTHGLALEGSPGGYEYVANVPASRAVGDYTPRLVPHHPEMRTPLEVPYILWQR